MSTVTPLIGDVVKERPLSTAERNAQRKRNAQRAAIIEAYDAFAAGRESMERTLSLARELAERKANHLDWEFGDSEAETAETAADRAQDVMVKVWRLLTTERETGKHRERTGAQWYAYLHRIAFNEAQAGMNDHVRKKRTAAPLFTQVNEAEEGAQAEYASHENPEIHDGVDVGGSWCLTSMPGLPWHELDITDKKIIGLLNDKAFSPDKQDYAYRTYADVAHIMGMKESAVAQRLHRIVKRYGALHEAKEERQVARDLDYRALLDTRVQRQKASKARVQTVG